ncbi:MAG: hypothetical protein CUN54_04915 [Phototrophicales bacterium]|nr:MAG: hypothetical protein CUN54_04915 [Phototrophicales bacterium]
MKRSVFAFSLVLLIVAASLPVMARPTQQDSAPTLVPPTLVPTVAPENISRPTDSAIARIQADGRVRVGTLFNTPPFAELNIRGEVSGFDADLMRSMAEAWGVEIEFVQVTRQTDVEMLNSGQVDLLVGAQAHRRDRDQQLEFSQSYFRNTQSVLVRNDDGAAVLDHFAGRKIGVVIGTPAEAAARRWQERAPYDFTIDTYFNLSQAVTAVVASEIDGVVSDRVTLSRLNIEPGLTKIIDDPVEPEPYAIAMRRHDINLRNLVNHTLQLFAQNGRLNEIHQANFGGTRYPEDTITIWAGLGDEAATPDQFGTGLDLPQQFRLPDILANQTLRVAGAFDSTEELSDSDRRIDGLNRALVGAMASRWGVRVEYIPNSTADPLSFVTNGQADLAVNIEPDWSLINRVDFSRAYLLHGQRLMIPANANISGFNDLRGGKWVGIFASEPGTADRVNALAESVNTAVNIFTITREQDAAFQLLVENNIDVVFGDSLKLIPHLEADPNNLALTERWYSRRFAAFALPRNDLDFRLLVDYTLQELERDGTLQSLLRPVTISPDDIPSFEIWPGSSEFAGLSLALQ